MSLIARKITVERSGKTLLSGIDFTANDGEMIGILGPSGSGKSTLLMALNGFRPATAGRVTLDGRDLYKDFEDLKHLIGFVPQDDIVPTALQVERTLAYAADLRLPDLDPETRKARVNGVIRTLGLSERKTARVATLSGGQRKRVSVAVELLSRPRLLFADEPTSGLDPALERGLTQTLRDLADNGNIVIVTTHIMSSLNLYDQLAVVVGGHLAWFGPPSQIKAWFKVEDFSEIYNVLDSRTPRQWAEHFKK